MNSEVKRHKWLAWLWALVVCALLGHNVYLWVVQRIVPDTDILALLPVQERDPILQQSFTHMVDAAQQRVIVLVGAPDWTDATRAADAYNAVLASHPGVLEAVKLSDETQGDWLAPFQKHSAALLTAQQEAQLRSERAQFWTDAALAKLYSAFSGPKLGAFRDDPFGLFSGWVQERAQETPVRPRDGKLFVSDAERQYVLMPLTMRAPAFSMTAQQTVVPLLEQAKQAALKAAPKANVITAGVVLHASAASGQAEGEMSTIGVGSLAGIVLLTWFTFRSLRPIALVLLSIGIGFLGSLSVCWLLFGRIHLLTLVFGASLIGVAQDYGIYFLCNRLSADPAENSVRLLKRLLPGLGLTLLAAVIGYTGLGFTPFPGLRHMAVFSAVGLVFAWLTVTCWFPLLVSGGTLRTGALARRYGATLARWPRVQLNAPTLIIAASFAVLAGFGWSRLGVNDDIRSLQTPPKHLIDDQIKLGKLLDAPTPVQYFLVRGASAEIVLQREEALKRRLDPLVAAKRIGGYQAMSNWVPSRRTQLERRELIDSKLLAPGGPLDSLAKAIDEDSAWSAATRAHLMAPRAPLTPEEFLKTPPSEPWRHLWLGDIEGVHASIVALRGMNMAALPDLRRAGEGMEGVQWVDKVAEISSVLGRYRQYMGWVVLAAYAVVFVLLYPRYRGNAWRVLAPTAVATIATLGVLGLAGQSLQLFHVLALMLLLGVGVDYGIFMQEHPGRRDTTPWLAVGLSAANTILSFGLLGLSRTPALQAFGLTMLIGTALAWLLVPCFANTKENEHA
ncbi:MMPL family transporter [Massilia antarctica]|uniref:MMPL family transporter n=1 Tax=Massilia antarctica TaxID=2765360 RepID=UPI0006BB6DF6|nr:MMPL family transporter [Massilia sp. H27-R4]CUI03553.1 FIG021862: membrane protein, exporter [Janthinobacterium sp. CG23_2]CUU27339.1 FIG021862: membrane protein, exporter [Janthinobacterium sp. CG23_2]